MCGENPFTPAILKTEDGSSPRVRGKLVQVDRAELSSGLIPACAGKTFSCSSGAWRSSAHPRVCGENKQREYLRDMERGSSPRVRGKPEYLDLPNRPRRLIPACAGKTPSPSAYSPLSAAHPRVCGENPWKSGKAGRLLGSSPRVRGKPTGNNPACICSGLIPACAGKT